MPVGEAEALNWKTLAELLCLLLVPHVIQFVFPACEQTSCDCCGRVCLIVWHRLGRIFARQGGHIPEAIKPYFPNKFCGV